MEQRSIRPPHWGVSALRLSGALALIVLLASCVTQPPGVSRAISWSKLPGWDDEQLSVAWPALLQDCTQMPSRDPTWAAICQDAVTLGASPDEATARAFFESHFVPHRVTGEPGRSNGLITGYYEPVLDGSLVRTERFRYPLYGRPPDLLTVDLGELYPELRGKPVRGRLQGTRVVPYFSRAQIDNGNSPLAGNELVWVDDPVGLFFLQVQGSGRIRLPDGEMLAVGYADQNGHPYVSIGKRLLAEAQLKPEQLTLATIRAWLAAHPDKVEELLDSNPSYVFFALRDPDLPGPLGSLQVPLTDGRSIAVDPRYIALGLPVWLVTTFPDGQQPLRRLVFAQDTGGAIKGPLRADLFFGQGDQAGELAGAMKEPGRLYVLLPAAPATATK